MGDGALRRAGGAVRAAQRPLAVERLPAVARAAGRPRLSHRLLRRDVGGARADCGLPLAARGAALWRPGRPGGDADPAAPARPKGARATLRTTAAYFNR